MAENIVIAKKLNKIYGTDLKIQVLYDIDLEIEKNSFTALIGPSGSGKSTLLSCLGLLEPPSSGEIIIDGNDFSEINVNKLSSFRNEIIGFVFQFHYLLPEFSAFENILIPYWIRSGKPGLEIERKAYELMERIGIDDIKNKSINQISGGQQQRVSIARALINNPKVILADEPTGNLDRETGTAVLDLLKEINSENGTTLVMVTHDRDVALNSDRIVELIDGKICKSIDMASTSSKKAADLMGNRACTITGNDLKKKKM